MLFKPHSLSAEIKFSALLSAVILSFSCSVSHAVDVSDINTEIDRCSKAHEYNPAQVAKFSPNELGANEREITRALAQRYRGTNEREFLKCVYAGIEEKIIPKAMLPNDYKALIENHKKMTNSVEKGGMTRQERKAQTEELLRKIKANEVAETERRIQDLSAKRDQFMQDRARMLKRNPRMF